MSDFVKIFYQLNAEHNNEIKSLTSKTSDFDRVVILNSHHIISIHYNFLEKELEINISYDHTYVFVNVPEKFYHALVGYLND